MCFVIFKNGCSEVFLYKCFDYVFVEVEEKRKGYECMYGRRRMVVRERGEEDRKGEGIGKGEDY